MSSFDPDTFLNETVDSEMSTRVIPCPPGEYQAMISGVGMREFTYKKGDRAGQAGFSLDVTWEIQDEGVKSSVGRDNVTVRQSMLLDFTPSGSLDTSDGRNIGLGRLREAVGQNKPGAPWSPRMLEGNVAVVLVEHRVDGDDLYAEIKKVRKV
jgi:hypothetical protein